MGAGRVAAWTHGSAGDPAVRPTLGGVGAGAFLEASADGLAIERGPYGGRPLYYAQDRGGVLVASRLAHLVDGLAERPRLDVDSLAALAVAEVAPDPRATVYRGVRRVLPCETVSFGIDGTRSTLRLPRVPELLVPDVEAHARLLREQLSHVVARELGAFSSVAVSTGGGLDSGGLFAVVARHAAASGGPRFTGATQEFGGPGDDRPHMVALLQMLGAGTVRATPREVGPLNAQFFAQDAAPFYWPTCPLELLAAIRAREWGAEAMFSGLGGDQALDGDDGVFLRRVRRGDLRGLVDAALLEVPWRSSVASRLRALIVGPLVRGSVPRSLLARLRGRQFEDVASWAGSRLRPVLRELEARPLEHDERQISFALSHSLMQLSDARGQAEASCGLPHIDPYLDPGLIELLASFPPEEFFHGGQMRGLFRLAMKGLLPESLRLRPDKASFEPMIRETVAVASRSPGFRELLTMEATADLGLVEPAPFREAFARLERGEPSRCGWLSVWPMLSIEGFVRSLDAGEQLDSDGAWPWKECEA